MNKISKLILLFPIIALAGCGVDDPKKPASNPSVSATSAPAPTSGEPYYRALTFAEVKESFAKVNETKSEIKSISKKSTRNDFEVVEEVPVQKTYVIESETRLFNNTIVYTSNAGETTDAYKAFGLYSEEYGSLVETYDYIDSNFENINHVSSFVKSGESNRKYILESVPYSITQSDNVFIIGKAVTSFDPESVKDQITVAAELSNGNYQIDYKLVTVFEGFENVIVASYLIQDGYLVSSSSFMERSQIVSEEVKNPIYKINIVHEYSYSPNGDFERSRLPSVVE